MNSRSLLFRSLAFYGNRLPHRGNERVLQVLRRLTGADVDEDIEVERRGRRWVLNPSDFVQGDVFWTGYKDYWDVWHLERLLPADAVLADVGANFGYYAIELCMALGPRARAVAFEPFPANFARLERHIRLNGLEERVQPLRLGLSDASGKAAMVVRGGESNSGSAQMSAEGTTIETVRLDEAWPTLGYKRLDLIKLDVEGHEVRALEGARGVVRQHRPLLLVEVDPARLQECGSSADGLVDTLRSLGYRLFQAQRRALAPIRTAAPRALINLFCIHEASRQLVG